MKMRDCSEYNDCNVPICPLDPDWEDKSLCKGEPSCPFILEASKEGAEERFKKFEHEPMWVVVNGPIVKAQKEKFPQLAFAVERASTTGSRWDQAETAGERLTAWRERE